jgi:hypothetical protein
MVGQDRLADWPYLLALSVPFAVFMQMGFAKV